MNTYELQATEEELEAFIAWAWSWFEYDPICQHDVDFRLMAKITWQLQDQLKD